MGASPQQASARKARAEARKARAEARRAEIEAVLGYWLEALRYEEALAGRPRARRPDARPFSVDLTDPGPGQAYFRVAGAAGFALQSDERLAVPAEGPILRFLEHWLRRTYRQQAAAATGEQEVRGQRWIIGWPALHFERREELATLLRFPVQLEWQRAGEPWKPPSALDRALRKVPPLPDTLLLSPSDQEDGDAGGEDEDEDDAADGEDERPLPFSLDVGILSRTLGVVDEDIQELTAPWMRRPPTPRRMVSALLERLGGAGADQGGDDAGLFAAMSRAVAARLPAGVSAYPAVIVQDATLLFATYHLQRELIGLLEREPDDPPLAPGTALASYLTGAPAPARQETLHGRWRPVGITPSQRDAGELFLGSTLAAVQGPPGTGKTELILNLAAHTVVEQARAIAGGQPFPADRLVVTSTNNRAVDNVLDPLTRDLSPDRLPLALRAGSQEVTGSATVEAFDRAIAWLSAQDGQDPAAALRTAVDALKAADRAWSAAARAAPDTAETQALGHALFLAAQTVRERWAVTRRDGFLPALRKARGLTAELRSLRRVFARKAAIGLMVDQLFPIIGCTLLSLGNVFDDDAAVIDRLVIDEAGQCHPAFAVGGLLRARQALLIGDVNQLPPVVQLSPGDEARVLSRAPLPDPGGRHRLIRVHEQAATSAQALADRAVERRPSLIDHFRCQPEIIGLSDELCDYALVVHTPRRTLSGQMPRLSDPVLLADVRGQQAAVRGSWANAREVEMIVELLLELGRAGVPWSEVAVLAPYVGQLELLRTELRRAGIALDGAAEDTLAFLPGMAAGGVATGTVHRFQGGERTVVLLSTTVTEPRSLPFLDRRVNLLNVAISRARDHLVVFGHAPVLARGEHTRLLVERARPLRA